MAMMVNGERVEDSAIQAEQMRLRRSGMPEEKTEAFARETLANRILMRQQAQEAQITIPDADVDVELLRQYAEAGGRERFFQQYRLSEKDEPRLRQHLTEELTMRRFSEQLTAHVTPPVEEDIRGAFEENKDRFVIPEQVHASHIVRRPQGPDDSQTYERMCALRQRLLAGASFAELANESSECSQEPNGDLGFFAKGQMVEPFEAVVFSLNLNEISPVFLTQFGYHIAVVHERRPPRQQEFAEVREQIADDLHEKRRQEALENHLDTLRNKADIRDVPVATKAPENAPQKRDKGKKKPRKK